MELEITRHLTAARGRVWRALTDEGELALWFWPRRIEPTVTADARVGGDIRIVSQAAGIALTATVRALDPERRLLLDWRWDGEDAVTVAELRLEPGEPGEGGTTLHVHHSGFESAEQVEQHLTGWTDCIDRLPEHLAGVDD